MRPLFCTNNWRLCRVCVWLVCVFLCLTAFPVVIKPPVLKRNRLLWIPLVKSFILKGFKNSETTSGGRQLNRRTQRHYEVLLKCATWHAHIPVQNPICLTSALFQFRSLALAQKIPSVTPMILLQVCRQHGAPAGWQPLKVPQQWDLPHQREDGWGGEVRHQHQVSAGGRRGGLGVSGVMLVGGGVDLKGSFYPRLLGNKIIPTGRRSQRFLPASFSCG